MANIKRKLITKQVMVNRGSWRGKQLADRKYTNVSITELDSYERVLVLNLGQLGEIEAALKLMIAAREAVGANSSFSSNGTKSVQAMVVNAIAEAEAV